MHGPLEQLFDFTERNTVLLAFDPVALIPIEAVKMHAASPP
jgi:hypothetical protein